MYHFLCSIYLCLLPLSDVKWIKVRMILLNINCLRVGQLGQGTLPGPPQSVQGDRIIFVLDESFSEDDIDFIGRRKLIWATSHRGIKCHCRLLGTLLGYYLLFWKYTDLSLIGYISWANVNVYITSVLCLKLYACIQETEPCFILDSFLFSSGNSLKLILPTFFKYHNQFQQEHLQVRQNILLADAQ